MILIYQLKFYSLRVFHRICYFSNSPHKSALLQKLEIFSSCSRSSYIDSRINSLFSNLSFKMDFHISRAFKFLIDNFIHFRTCIYQAVAKIVKLPPSSKFLAAPKNLFGLSRAFESTPPLKIFPEAG